MSADVCEGLSTTYDGVLDFPGLVVDVYPEGDACAVHIRGELDIAARNIVVDATTAGQHPMMIVDLAGVTFMDCDGYGCLVASRLILEASGRTLTLRGQTGQPGRLLAMIAQL